MERDEASLPQGDFVTQLFSGRLDYNFSPERDLVEPRPVRQRLEAPRLPEPVPLDPEARQRPVPRGGPRLVPALDGDYVPSFDKASAKLQYTFRL